MRSPPLKLQGYIAEFDKSCGAWGLFGSERTVGGSDGTDYVDASGIRYTIKVKSFEMGQVGQHR